MLRSIDNVAIDQWFHQRRPLISASSNCDARSQLFHYDIIFPPRFSLALASGRIVTVDRTQRLLASHTAPNTQARWLAPGRIGYIQIPSFGEMRFIDTAVSFLRDFRTAVTVIFDLRGNGGGPPEGTATSLLDALLAEPLQYSGRATVIGETTAGTFAPTVTVDFGEGRSGNIAKSLERFPDGTQFEGTGIALNVAISVKAEDIRSGLDPVLDAARGIAAGY